MLYRYSEIREITRFIIGRYNFNRILRQHYMFSIDATIVGKKFREIKLRYFNNPVEIENKRCNYEENV